MATTILILVVIGLVLGILIYVVNIVIPQKVQGLERTEQIAALMPGANCGACGNPSCFAYARNLTQDSNYLSTHPCSQILGNAESLEQIERLLGVTVDAEEMSRKAVIRCAGNSEVIFTYSGIASCKGAALLQSGNKKCPHACLGFGDCAAVCPQKAISIDEEKNTAAVDGIKCTGCGLCVAECPRKLIELVSSRTRVVLLCSYQTLRDLPGREKCDFGCIHCRRCLKACEFGAISFNAEKGIPVFDREKCTLCMKCIEVCPQGCLAEFGASGRVQEAALSG